jgi:hypothetical protein
LPNGTNISRALQAADYENIGRLKVGRPLSSYGGSTFSRTFYYNDGLYVEPGFPAGTFNSPMLVTAPICTPGTRGKLYLNVT